jgi:hypothetical protein
MLLFNPVREDGKNKFIPITMSAFELCKRYGVRSFTPQSMARLVEQDNNIALMPLQIGNDKDKVIFKGETVTVDHLIATTNDIFAARR